MHMNSYLWCSYSVRYLELSAPSLSVILIGGQMGAQTQPLACQMTKISAVMRSLITWDLVGKIVLVVTRSGDSNAKQ